MQKAISPKKKWNKTSKGLKFNCFGCGKPVKTFGALLFSPPHDTMPDGVCDVEKFHLCVMCYDKLMVYIISDKLK